MRRGLVEGFLSYLLWGLLPIYWKQLGDVAALDVVANRLVWTFVLLMGVQVARSTWRDLVKATADHRMMMAMLVSGLLLTLNWLVYIWAVDQDRVVDASLGYFINPLVAVFLGVVVLGERLPAVQWVAIVIAGLGVAWLTIEVGRLPWISLILAFSFGLYGLIRKTARVESFNGLTIEMGWFFVPALVFAIVRGIGGEPGAITEDAAVAPLLVLTGAVTAAPLLLFASAARRVPLATIGLLQYVAPTLQLIIGVWVYGEMFDGGQLIGFSLIWLALVVFSTDVMRRYFGRRSPTPVLQPAG